MSKTKPVINLNELKFVQDKPGFPGSHAPVASRIGAKKLGYNISVCPPGKSVCPFHNHRINEEMFLILEGEGLLRFGSAEYPLRPLDIVACPPGGREVAHQMINTGKVDLKYLALSTMIPEEICEYPDSDKVGVFVGNHRPMELRQLFKASSQVDYMDGENSPLLKG